MGTCNDEKQGSRLSEAELYSFFHFFIFSWSVTAISNDCFVVSTFFICKQKHMNRWKGFFIIIFRHCKMRGREKKEWF